MTQNSQPIRNCQVCKSDKLTPKLFLGYVPPVNTMRPINKPLGEENAYPLEWFRCESCGLVQIGFEVDPNILFPPEYPYLSGTTRILRENFADLCQESKKMLALKSDGLVVDIGSNDGTLLKNFVDSGFPVLGIEPSQAADVANKNGVHSIIKFFGEATAQEARKTYGPAQLITAANVFAHIGNVHGVVEGIKHLLTDDGVFISESHYLASLIETVQYDTIYHEHLRYYSLHSLKNLLAEHDLEVFFAKRIPTHGGSIRVYAARKGQRQISSTVAEILKAEDAAGVTDGTAIDSFRERVTRSKVDLIATLGKIHAEGGKVYGIGAPSRASTLVSYTGLDADLMNCIMEVSGSHKLNKYMPGTNIPVLDEKKLYKDQPEYVLLLSWHIADELIPILKKNGFKGKCIVPLPELHIV